MPAHRTNRHTAVSGLPAAGLIAANGGTVPALPKRLRLRTAAVALAAATLAGAGTGTASAAPVQDRAVECGPGYMAVGARCVVTVLPDSEEPSLWSGVVSGGLGVAALVGLLIVG